MSLYVICDNARLYRQNYRNTHFLDIRRVNRHVVASRCKQMLEHMKSREDPYMVTEISESLLTDFCKDNNCRVMMVERCYCDLRSCHELCEVHFL